MFPSILKFQNKIVIINHRLKRNIIKSVIKNVGTAIKQALKNTIINSTENLALAFRGDPQIQNFFFELQNSIGKIISKGIKY
jgi:hypothetical protein